LLKSFISPILWACFSKQKEFLVNAAHHLSQNGATRSGFGSF
jgi:hypothetical protein